MKLSEEEIPQINFSIVALISYMEFALKTIKTGSSYTDKPLKEIKLMRDAAYGFLLDFNSTKNEESSIDALNSEQVQQRIFISEAAGRRDDSEEHLLSPSARGFVADIANPVLQFTLGKNLEFSEEISESAYAQFTENIRDQLKHLGENQIFLEAMAAARLVLINGMINKTAWLLAGCEPLPNPKWLEGTTTYRFASDAYDFIAKHTPESIKKFKSEVIDNTTKIFNKQGKNIASLGLTILSEKSTYLDIASDATTLAAAAYGKYSIQVQNRVLNDELSYLREYIESQNRIQDLIKERPELRDCINTNYPPISFRLDNADKELKKILSEYPVIGKIFNLDQKKFRSLKEKILFIEVAKDLIKKNNETTNPKDKLWNDPNAEISKGKKVVAQHYFKKFYIGKLKQFKEQGVDLLTNNASEPSYFASLVTYPKFLKAANKFRQALSSGNPSAAIDSLNILYYAFCKYYNDRKIADSNNQTLAQIQAYRMYVPRYDVSYDSERHEILGRDKIELAKMSLARKAQAIALEKMSNRTDIPTKKKKLLFIYKRECQKAKKRLLATDPLFAEERKTSTWKNWLYSTSTEILNAANPWGKEVKIDLKGKKNSSVENTSKAVTIAQGSESSRTRAENRNKLASVVARLEEADFIALRRMVQGESTVTNSGRVNSRKKANHKLGKAYNQIQH